MDQKLHMTCLYYVTVDQLLPGGLDRRGQRGSAGRGKKKAVNGGTKATLADGHTPFRRASRDSGIKAWGQFFILCGCCVIVIQHKAISTCCKTLESHRWLHPMQMLETNCRYTSLKANLSFRSLLLFGCPPWCH